jgi:hypothetical protein
MYAAQNITSFRHEAEEKIVQRTVDDINKKLGADLEITDQRSRFDRYGHRKADYIIHSKQPNKPGLILTIEDCSSTLCNKYAYALVRDDDVITFKSPGSSKIFTPGTNCVSENYIPSSARTTRKRLVNDLIQAQRKHVLSL